METQVYRLYKPHNPSFHLSAGDHSSFRFRRAVTSAYERPVHIWSKMFWPRVVAPTCHNRIGSTDESTGQIKITNITCQNYTKNIQWIYYIANILWITYILNTLIYAQKCTWSLVSRMVRPTAGLPAGLPVGQTAGQLGPSEFSAHPLKYQAKEEGQNHWEAEPVVLRLRINIYHRIWGVSINGVPQKWMVYFMENPTGKWMITRGTPISGNPHMVLNGDELALTINKNATFNIF